MLRPLNDYVVLEVEPSEKKVGGIILTEKKDKTGEAKVVAVGPGIKKDGEMIPIPVKIGDKVLFKEYSTTEYKDGDTKYLVLQASDILAVIE